MSTTYEDEENKYHKGEEHQASLVAHVNSSNSAAASNSDEVIKPVYTINHDRSEDDVAARIRRRRQSSVDDADLDPIILPKSTHTLLFTEPIHSVPFAISLFIASLSIICLLLALFNSGLSRGLKDVIPANVDVAVKTAQYTSIFIALLMEEEIPTGLYFLKRMPRQYFKSAFPELRYEQFLIANVLRIVMGYLFLVNVLIILIMASDVLQIFFDFIALQFIQQLDDIAFKLAQMSMLSLRLKEATTRRYFKTEFKQTMLGHTGRAKSFFTIIYFFNMCCLLAGMIYVSVNQASGNYQCRSITVNFNEDVWEDAIVKLPNQTFEERILVYSYFNGVYVQDGTRHDGRPVYVERSKHDGTEFDTISPSPTDPFNQVKVPAKIQYCKKYRAWVFIHEDILKSKRYESDCPWLLRSAMTEVYDVKDVDGSWEVWRGMIETTDVRITCNECNDDDDCNLNGICKEDGSCGCFNDIEGMKFLGQHCEVIVDDECRTIIGEIYNDSYSAVLDWDENEMVDVYNRPVYQYSHGSGLPLIDLTNDTFYLSFSGSRWYGNVYPGGELIFEDDLYRGENEFYLKNYHAFWDRVYTSRTKTVSDPVTRTRGSPVGVDFFTIRERSDQFGPFGERHPLQKFNLTGRGNFRCAGRSNF